ncbi:MAG: Gldg family protein [Nitrospinota bacterium]
MKKFAKAAGWLTLISGFMALFFYIVLPDLKVLIFSLTAISISNGIFYLISEGTNLKKFFSSRTAQHGTNAIVLTAVFLGILIFVNLLIHRHKHRFDFTEGNLFTLAPQTKKFVSNLPREVKLTAFFQVETAEKIAFSNLISGYQEETEKIDVTYVDPDKNPAVTKQYGVTTYGTIVLESGSKETKIQNATEENLTNALLKVTRDEQKTIYFLEGHGESQIDSTENEGYQTARKNLEQDGFKVKSLLLLQTGEIPEDASALVIAGPKKPIQIEEQKALQAYLDKGGAVMLLADPKAKHGMENFLKNWGIELGGDIVIDPLSKLFGGDFAAPVVNQYTVHEITSDFALATIFPIIQSVKTIPSSKYETVELLKTSANSWGESDFESGTVKFDEATDLKGPVPVAVVTTKLLEKGKAEKETGEPHEHKKNQPKASLVVIGDSDFANNRYTSFSGNGDFFLNAVSWLAEEENLISIRPKEKKNTPIHLTKSWGSAIFVLGLLVFPGIVAGTGIRIWWRRRGL